MFTSYQHDRSMQRSQSEPWYNEVEPLKIKSALTRRTSKAKLKGPREFSPLIGSSRPKKAVTFDRTDEVITYEQLTPEVHDEWIFEDQEEYVLSDEYDEQVYEQPPQAPLHSLPDLPENPGIEKSVSEPSIQRALVDNRLSRGERVGAMIDASPVPTFRPGHKHKDSWRGSWGTITDSLGAGTHAEPIAPSPFVGEVEMFDKLPAPTRKESLQDDQRRPKTVHVGPVTKRKSKPLERTHSQRKRAIRNILEGDSIATIQEESELEPPELPPHSPIPSSILDSAEAPPEPSASPPPVPTLRVDPASPRRDAEISPYVSRADVSYSHRVPVSPSLESVATFDANVASVERAESSIPVLTSLDHDVSFDYGQPPANFQFGKTRTSTPSEHPLPNAPCRIPSPINESPAGSPLIEKDTSEKFEHALVATPESPEQVTDPVDVVADPVPTSVGIEERRVSDPWSKYETTEDVEKAYMIRAGSDACAPKVDSESFPESAPMAQDNTVSHVTTTDEASDESNNTNILGSLPALEEPQFSIEREVYQGSLSSESPNESTSSPTIEQVGATGHPLARADESLPHKSSVTHSNEAPDIPERISSAFFTLPDISMSPSGLNANMFNSSAELESDQSRGAESSRGDASILNVLSSQRAAAHDRTIDSVAQVPAQNVSLSQASVGGAGNDTIANVLEAYDNTEPAPSVSKIATSSMRSIAPTPAPVDNTPRDAPTERVLDSLNDSYTHASLPQSSSNNIAAWSTSTSQNSLSRMADATCDIDVSTMAVHDKNYAVESRPAPIQEEASESYEQQQKVEHIDVRQAPPLIKRKVVDKAALTTPVTSGPVVNTTSIADDVRKEIQADKVEASQEAESPDQSLHATNFEDTTVEALRPNVPDFSFVETRKTTPLTVKPLAVSPLNIEKNTSSSSEEIGNATHASDISRVSMKETPAIVVETPEINDADNISETAEFSIMNSPGEADKELESVDAIKETAEQEHKLDTISAEQSEADVNLSRDRSHLYTSSVEPLVIRSLDSSKTGSSLNDPSGNRNSVSDADITDSTPARKPSLKRDVTTNMISPPTPSLPFSRQGSRVTSGSSAAANGTVLHHTSFQDDSILDMPPRPTARLGFIDNTSPQLQEKHQSPHIGSVEQELVLDSDLSEDENHDGGEWITESEFSSKRVGLGSSMFGSEYSAHIPGRIPTFQGIDKEDFSSTRDPNQFSSTVEPSSQTAFGYPSTGTSTMPNSTNSRWSVDSFKDDSIFSMQLGQSIDSLSTDLNRVASGATIDHAGSETGYILHESDSIILANADRPFKTVRRRTTRRKPVPVSEALSPHKEEDDENDEVAKQLDDKTLSVRKRNEQTSFATRQPSHIVVSRNVTGTAANRSTNRVSSSVYDGSRENSVADRRNQSLVSDIRVETPMRPNRELEATAPIREPSPKKILPSKQQSETPQHADVRQAPPTVRRPMADLEEVAENTPRAIMEQNYNKFESMMANDSIAEQTFNPRPVSSYQPREPDFNLSAVSNETYRNRHKSCPVMAQEKGHLFIRIESISGYNLPEGGQMNFVLDNGEQKITSESQPIGKETMFGTEYDMLVRDGLNCEMTIRAFPNSVKDKRASFSKIFKRKKDSNVQPYTPIATDGMIGFSKISLKDIRQYAFGKPYSVSMPCFDRCNEVETCHVNVKMMFVPIMSRADKFPTTMSEAIREIEAAKHLKQTAMTGFMTQSGGDCKNPKRRYFVLDDDMLIAHSENSFKPRASINLRKAVYLAPDSEDPYKFRINFRNGAFIAFTVDSQRQKWMEALDTTIHNKRNRSSWLSLVMYNDEKTILNDIQAAPRQQTVI